eukprot:366462-Chlamydomonas_euryale.AAC.15
MTCERSHHASSRRVEDLDAGVQAGSGDYLWQRWVDVYADDAARRRLVHRVGRQHAHALQLLGRRKGRRNDALLAHL